MRKNLPDRKLTMKEKLDLQKHHYEKPDHVCDCGCGYHRNTCMKGAQEAWAVKQEELKQQQEVQKEDTKEKK